ncbi:4-amino-4-deoxy-L-arabinose transferase-like glycosyltransferase [Micromonospora echinospora]|uniref:4-amino-4-deoxy-L-arabinose transferase-like glycosyltransferase n=1 Tax=Micromonospora echinospora TaxID=1877 RepID=A0ABR6ME96_MICEC|nr:glycosyltransferase family 39 protein [Micromonospora echinospora]MBB5113702.1 4-amino-4-deoxy-L-arabinose transferase-like glycosyltransferase [Micromonospora echinospora]
MDRTESLLTAPAAGPPGTVPVPLKTRTGSDPRWARPALLGLLAATGLFYLWGLGASGWANAFYSAAVQAGSQNWTAFLYGSSDAANSITVDKTPASLWLMALSVRIFGLSSWSILVPQALLGVASVGVLYATVRRWYGPAAGLLAGAVLALTPVATLMFRFNNPDALLVLLLVAAAYATVRAVETASTRWIALTGVLVGFGFLTKMLQAFLVIPVFAGVYLLAAPSGLARRIRQLLLAGLAVVISAGWWVAIVELVPVGARPYVGGSQNNSILELTLGYNGLGRITGDEVGSVGGSGGRPGGGPFSGQAGLLRMFDTEVGGQISWLLPAALILLVAGLWLAGRAPRTDRTRAGLLLWGGWLLVTGLIFSFMSGIFHAYYTVALAPAVGALVGIGVTVLWRARSVSAPAGSASVGSPPVGSAPAGSVGPARAGSVVAAGAPVVAGRGRALVATLVLAGTLAVTAWWSWQLLGRTPDWHPWLRTAVLALGLTAAALLAALPLLPSPPSPDPAVIKEFVSGEGAPEDANSLVNSAGAGSAGTESWVGRRVVRWAVPVLSVAGLAVALAGPAAYAMQTASTPHTGSIPSAGPSGAGGFGPGGRMPGGGNGQFPGGPGRGNGQFPGFPGGGGFPGFPGGQNSGGQNGGQDGGGQDGGFSGFPGGGQAPGAPGVTGQEGRGPDGRGQRGGGMGGLLDAREPSAEMTALLTADADDYTWVAATIGSNNASGYQLATGRPVMPIGGFNGSDPSPTLTEFQRYVADGRIHYFLGGGGFRANGGSNASAEIAAWVAGTFTATTVDGVTVYDLSSGKRG